MVQTVTATYARKDENWTVHVSGLGATLESEASGIVAARDRADQLVSRLASGDEQPTVVHLIDGSAVEFTSAYLAARLSRDENDGNGGPPGQTTRAAESTTAQATVAESTTERARKDTAVRTDTTGVDSTGTVSAAEDAEEAASGDPDADGSDESGSENETSGTETTAEPMRVRAHAVPRKELSRTPQATPDTPDTPAEAAPAGTDARTYAHATH